MSPAAKNVYMEVPEASRIKKSEVDLARGSEADAWWVLKPLTLSVLCNKGSLSLQVCKVEPAGSLTAKQRNR